jgi:hypothetical protein
MPEMSEFVVEAVGGGDDAEFFDAAAEGIGDRGVDGSPDGVGRINFRLRTSALLKQSGLPGER